MCDQLVPDCSGNGILDNVTGLCNCFPGFSSRADFRYAIGKDCDVQPNIVMALWITLSVLFFIPFALSSVRFTRSVMNQGWKRTLNIKYLDSKLHLLILVESAAFVTMSIIKATSIETRLFGMDETVTYLYLIVSALLPFVGRCLVDIMFELTLKQMRFRESRNKEKVIYYMRVYEWILIAILFATSFALWSSVYAQYAGCLLLQICLTLNGIVFFVGLIIPPAAINIILKDVRLILQNSEGKPVMNLDMIKTLHDRLVAVRGQLVGMNVINSVWFIATANSPFLIRKVFYTYPVMLISGIPMLLIIGTVSTSGYSRTNTSSDTSRIIAAEKPHDDNSPESPVLPSASSVLLAKVQL
jgi:hypothetical protein